MKVTWLVIASLMTSCSVLGAPSSGRVRPVRKSATVDPELRKDVMNKARIDMMKDSDIALNKDGTWSKGWLNNDDWRTASDTERISEMWTLHKLRHRRSFTNAEESRRRSIFEKKVAEVVAHNVQVQLGNEKYTLALNSRSDMTPEELSVAKGYKRLVRGDIEDQEQDVKEGEYAYVTFPYMPDYTNTVPIANLPLSVNWSNTPWVGPVQDQGQCGSCWSFSAAGALEAQYYNKTQTFVSMSEENLVDCTYYLGNLGCDGGDVELAFDYVMTVGIDTYSSYPYVGLLNNGTCLYNSANSVTQNTGGWRLIPSGDELALQQAIALVGPVSAALDASLPSFDSYSGGIYAPVDCSTTAVDHAILIVGYGTQNGEDYWLVKNSWGTEWGINGYFMIKRGVNMCGIASYAVFPVID